MSSFNNLTQKFDVLILGAGSTGLFTAWHLSQISGLKIAVLDGEKSFGQGQNKAAIGGIRATHSISAKIQLGRESLQQFEKLSRDFNEFDIGFRRGGYLFPAYRETEKQDFLALLEIQRKFQLNIDWYEGSELLKIAPDLNPEGLLGGTYSPEDGSASPLKVLAAIYLETKDRKVEFLFNQTVDSFIFDGNTIKGVVTESKTEFWADTVINCLGAGANAPLKYWPEKLPVIPETHQAGVTEKVQRFLEPMIVDMRPAEGSRNYYFYQNEEKAVIFCLTPEPPLIGEDRRSTSDFLPQISRRMIGIMPRLKNIKVRRIWAGLYPMTPDGNPIIGFHPRLKNLLMAVGFCGQGFMFAPAAGKILAELAIGKTLNPENQFVIDSLKLDRNFSCKEAFK